MKTIYVNGTILTMNDDLPIAQALCIEDGKIIKAGNYADVMAICDDAANIIDLKGHTLLPGFIDGHSHFVGVANSFTQCDLSNATSFKDIKAKLTTFIKQNETNEDSWIFGSGYDHNRLKEQDHPNRYLLDEVSTAHPIVLSHASSHMGVANSKALELMHITRDTPNMDGGVYRRDKDGELDGFMEENAFIQFQNKAPMPSIEQLMKMIVKAGELYASYGITTIQDGMVAEPLFQLLQLASAKHLLKQDVIGYIDLLHCRDLTTKYKDYVQSYHDHFKIGGYKIFLDGSPQGRTAWMKTPYQDDPDYYGYPVLQDEDVYRLIREACEDGLQLLAHCNGDAASEQYITQFENVMRDYPEYHTHRPVMIHAQLVNKEQLKRMPALHMMPSFFAAHTYYWGDVHIKNFGYKRACQISPAKSALDLQIPFTFHQDSPVIPCDMMRTLWCAVNRKTLKGVSIGKEESLDVYDALKAITINGAYQYFEEDKKGSLREGKLADLVILDHNPLTYDPSKLHEIQVLETIKEGTTIFKR